MKIDEFREKADLCLDYYNRVMNGGHGFYFFNTSNTGFDDYQSIVEALKSLGAEKQANVLVKAIALYEAEKQFNANNTEKDMKDELLAKFDEEFSRLDRELDCKPDISDILEEIFETVEEMLPATGTLIEQYIKQIEIALSTHDDFSDSINLMRGNRAAKQRHRIAETIEKEHPELKNEFMELLNNTNYQSWVAFQMVNSSMNYDIDAQRKAIAVIKKIANGNGSNAFGSKIWLKNWYQKNPDFLASK